MADGKILRLCKRRQADHRYHYTKDIPPGMGSPTYLYTGTDMQSIYACSEDPVGVT